MSWTSCTEQRELATVESDYGVALSGDVLFDQGGLSNSMEFDLSPLFGNTSVSNSGDSSTIHPDCHPAIANDVFSQALSNESVFEGDFRPVGFIDLPRPAGRSLLQDDADSRQRHYRPILLSPSSSASPACGADISSSPPGLQTTSHQGRKQKTEKTAKKGGKGRKG
jgi:hypothetical protein